MTYFPAMFTKDYLEQFPRHGNRKMTARKIDGTRSVSVKIEGRKQSFSCDRSFVRFSPLCDLLKGETSQVAVKCRLCDEVAFKADMTTTDQKALKGCLFACIECTKKLSPEITI